MSLKPVRSKHKRNSHPRLQGGQWGYKYRRKFDPSVLARTLPKLAILGLILSGIIFVPLTGYYYFQVASNQPPPNSSHDPFTTLWTGVSNATTGSVTTPIVFDSMQNGTASGSGSVAKTFTVAVGDIIIVGIFEPQPVTVFTVTDTQSNTYTQRAASPSTVGQTQFQTAKMSGSGSDTVTVSSTAAPTWDAAILQYSGAGGFGSSASSEYTPGTAASGTDTLSLTTVSSSFILEIFDAQSASAAACSNISVTANNGQNNREAYCPVGVHSVVSDVTGFSGTNSIGYSFTFSSCVNSNCFRHHSALELTAGSTAGTCLYGYQCQNTSIVNKDIQTNPNSTFPGIVLTNSSVDLSTGSDKAIAFGFSFASAPLAKSEFGWFLRLNGTLPTASKYSPTNDTSVTLAVIQQWSSSSQYDDYVYMQRTIGQKLFAGSEDPFPTCPQAFSLFLCVRSAHGANDQTLSLVLNFTGGATGNSSPAGNAQSYLCIDFGVGATTCNLGGINNQAVSVVNTNFAVNYTQPWLNLQNNYYIGFWDSAGSSSIEWETNHPAVFPSPIISVYTVSVNPDTTTGGFFGWVGRALGGAWNAAAGALSPITSPILGLGNSMLAVFVSGLIQAGNLLIKGMAVLESVMVLTMNAVGNFIGWGNVGTSMQQLINSMVTLFTNGSVSTFFGDLPTVVSRFIDFINITVPWLPIAFNTASNVVLLGVNGIVFIPTLVQFTFFFVSGIFVTVLFVFWFIYTGDDALGGILAFLETAEWFIFGLGVGLVSNIVNFFLDIVTYLIGLIPKPLVQMVAHGMPRLPIVQTGARFVSPSFDLGEIRSGNMLSALSWIIGLTFICWYESVTPALPGSIGGLLPAAAPTLVPLATLLPLLEILTALVGVAALVFWPLTRAMEFLVGDLGGVPVSLGPGRRLNAGPSGISVRKAEKRFQGRLEKKIAERKGFEATERQIKEAGASSQGVG